MEFGLSDAELYVEFNGIDSNGDEIFETQEDFILWTGNFYSCCNISMLHSNPIFHGFEPTPHFYMSSQPIQVRFHVYSRSIVFNR